jgi:hypothetical protein
LQRQAISVRIFILWRVPSRRTLAANTFEITVTAKAAAGTFNIGIANGSAARQGGTPGTTAINVNNSNCPSTFSVGDVIGIAVDYTNHLIWRGT